jgi:DNA modification methylase
MPTTNRESAQKKRPKASRPALVPQAGNGGGLVTETVPIDSLKPDPKNVRVHDAKNLKAITASLREFGQQHPALTAMDETMRGIVGFSAADFDKLPGNAEVQQDTPPAVFQAAVSKAGDLWTLGDHRLLCGSSTVLEDVQRVMAGDKAALVATDPPYLVDYTGARAGGSGKDWSSEYDEAAVRDPEAFFRSLFSNVLQVLAPNAPLYCWHAHRRVGMLQKVWGELQILDHQAIVWIKPSSVFGSCMYHFQHEPCMVGWRQGSKPKMDGKHRFTSVWVLPSDVRAQVALDEMSDVIAADWDGKSRPVGNEHPTEKPVEIFARPMRKHTEPGDVVFEPFSGSGSQLSAAEQLGRKCRAIELSPVFVDVAVRRWQRLTGKAAVLEGSGGRTWREVAADRSVVLPKDLV